MTLYELTLARATAALLAHAIGEFDYEESVKALEGVNTMLHGFDGPKKLPRTPFGFVVNEDPLYICFSDGERNVWQKALQQRAMYVLPGDNLMGYRFSRVVILGAGANSMRIDTSFNRWLAEDVTISLPPGGRVLWT